MADPAALVASASTSVFLAWWKRDDAVTSIDVPAEICGIIKARPACCWRPPDAAEVSINDERTAPDQV